MRTWEHLPVQRNLGLVGISPQGGVGNGVSGGGTVRSRLGAWSSAYRLEQGEEAGFWFGRWVEGLQLALAAVSCYHVWAGNRQCLSNLRLARSAPKGRSCYFQSLYP